MGAISRPAEPSRRSFQVGASDIVFGWWHSQGYQYVAPWIVSLAAILRGIGVVIAGAMGPSHGGFPIVDPNRLWAVSLLDASLVDGSAVGWVTGDRSDLASGFGPRSRSCVLPERRATISADPGFLVLLGHARSIAHIWRGGVPADTVLFFATYYLPRSCRRLYGGRAGARPIGIASFLFRAL